MKTCGVSTILWSTDCKFDNGIVKLPIFSAFGYPLTRRGVTQFPGMYFVGLPWMDRMKNGMFLGLKENAQHIAEKIDRQETAINQTFLMPS